ncbi:glycosyltransferase family 9 protein [candidate division KSB1 bacterium]|nr:MAG: glycosyltransferase family 9 protein [candidate division KSB1 bacterium]
MESSPKRIAALLFRRVGDSLLATPALRAIKKCHPHSSLSVIAEPHVARIFEYNPWIDEIIPVRAAPSFLRLAVAVRRGGKPDATVDFLSDPRSAFGCFLSGAKQRIGLAISGRQWAYTHLVPTQNTTDPVYSGRHKLDLAAALGSKESDVTTEFHLTEDDRVFAEGAWKDRGWREEQLIVAFFVHSRRIYKRWPLDGFCQLIQRIQNEGRATALLLVTPGDETSAAVVRAKACLPARNVLDVSDLGRLGAVLNHCALLIGNDGGPKHLAVALNVPTLTIFGAESPVYWTPPDDPRHTAITPILPLAARKAPSFDEVSVDHVFEAAIQMLKPAIP